MSSVQDDAAKTPPAPVFVAPVPTEEEKRARRRHRYGLIAAAGSVLVASGAFAAIIVHAHFSEPGAVDALAPRPVAVKSITVEAVPADAVETPSPETATIEAAPLETAAAVLPPADDIPEATDPRWAKSAALPTSAAAAVAAPAPGATAFAALEAMRNGFDSVDAEAPDGLETAAIDPEETRPAPTEKKPTAEKKPGIVASDRPAQRMAKVTSDVRLRAAPNAKSAVIGVVASGAEIGIVACDGWCEVISAGKRGFVYKRFIGETKAVRRATSATVKAANGAAIGRNPGNRNPAEVGP